MGGVGVAIGGHLTCIAGNWCERRHCNPTLVSVCVIISRRVVPSPNYPRIRNYVVSLNAKPSHTRASFKLNIHISAANWKRDFVLCFALVNALLRTSFMAVCSLKKI